MLKAKVGEERRQSTVGFDNGGRACGARNAGDFWKLEKARKRIPQEEHRPAWTLALAPEIDLGPLTSRTVR